MLALLAALVAPLAACTERLAELDPRPGIANLFFGTHLEGREPPPGLDQPWPNLSSVPERPTPPDQATRERLSAGLAGDRERSRTPVGAAPGRLVPAGSGPPGPPRLAAVPAIRVEPAPATPPAAAPSAGAPMPGPGLPGPGLPGPLPAPLAAPPAAPGRDLLAPPPPSGDLLAPRRD